VVGYGKSPVARPKADFVARIMVKSGMVNGRGFEFLRAVKIAIFRDSAYENAILKLR